MIKKKYISKKNKWIENCINERKKYLIKRDNKGTSIGFMGGSKVFIQASEIKSQSFLAGRSFMVEGLIEGYSDEQVADLLAYIKTLK